MPAWLFKPDKHLFRGLAILLAAGGILALTWDGAREAILSQHQEARDRVTASVVHQDMAFADQISHQIVTLDQTLRILVHAWETDPRSFELQAWHTETQALNDVSRDMILVDENGIVRQSTIPEVIGTNVGDPDYFVFARQHGVADDAAFIGPASIDPIMRQWHMNVARWLHHPDGSFAGALVADYRLTAITSLMRESDLGMGGILALIGLADGRLRANAGPGAAEPDTNISGSPMFAAIQAGQDTWTGPSAPDAVKRIHAFVRIANRGLVVVSGEDFNEALAWADTWEWRAKFLGWCVTILVGVMTLILLRGLAHAKRREVALALDRAVLAAANAQLEVAKAFADAKTAQLEATLAGMSDGVSMIDGHLCLVEWNARFPDIAGVPHDLLRVGMPMEEILRAQARAGQFGAVDPDAEVERRMESLRTGRSIGTIERRRPDGRIMELRRNRLPDGGFVTLYADITDRKVAEQALREARALADTANQAKSRFVAIVSHEIRNPLAALLSALKLLSEDRPNQDHRVLVDTARQSGDALASLIDDILDMASMEAGQLTLRPSVFALRPMLDSAIELFLPQAAERGIDLLADIAPDVPESLFADPGRLRQVLINLLGNAVKFGRPGAVILLARLGDRQADGTPTLNLAVRDGGPVIPDEERARLFRPFSRLDRPAGDEPVGTGLGLAICHHLVGLMGGEIGCRPWPGLKAAGARSDGARRPGNEFWLRLPLRALPAPGPHIQRHDRPDYNRMLPRTRILLVEDVPANQLVTATMLRREGHLVDVASSGSAAIRAVGLTPYDLVLMDIFMPGEDGLDTTRRIRAMRGPAEALPILALTASVNDEVRTLVRQSGMDGLLSKPVALPALLNAIADHVWHGLPERGQLPEPPAPPSTVGRLLAAGRIEELRSNLPPAVLADMVEDCLRDFEVRLPRLRQALESGSRGEVVAQTHALAGLAAGYGMAALEDRLRALVDSNHTPPNGVTAWNAEMEATLRGTAEALRALTQTELA
jgi:signal transduction histidine kinase/ActR/RegA family two-component response regulator